MKHAETQTQGLQVARVANYVELFSNLYSRVAARFSVDRSYVCRVARGERRSDESEAGLIAEFERIREDMIKPKGRFHSVHSRAA